MIAPEGELQARLDAFVTALRARRRRVVRAQSALLALALSTGSLWVVAIGAGFAPSMMWQVLLGLLVVGGGLFGGARHRYALRPRSDAALLHEFAGDAPAQRALLALAELDAQPGRSDRGLLRLFRQRVVDLLGKEDPARWIPATRLLPSAGALALVALAWLATAGFARAHLAAGLVDLITAIDDRALPSKTPLLRQLTIEIEAPAYTGLPRRPLGDSTGNVRALPGSKLHFVAVPRDEAERARIVWAPADEAQPGASSRKLLVGSVQPGFATSLPVIGPTRYHFETYRDGVWWKEPVERRVELDVDRAPRVELKAAADALELEAPRPVELQYAADDDYGLAELALEWQVEGGAIERRVLESPAGKSAQAKLEWDLRELSLPSGKRISYWIVARDNNPTAPTGPGIGKSRILTLSLRTAQQDHERTLGSQKELLEQALRLLADRLEKPTDTVEAARALHGALPNFVRAVREAVAKLESDKGARRDLGKKLGELATRVDKLVGEEDRLLSSVPVKADKLPPLAARIVAELEDDVLLLEGLVGRERLEEMAAIAQEMKRTKEQLKQLLADYKKAPTSEKRKEIERQLAELQKRLAELQRKMAEAGGEVPDEFMNQEAIANQSMESQMEKIQRLLDKGDIEGAMKELEKLSADVDAMAKQLDQNSDGLRNERFGADEKRLAELENEIAELSHEESEIKAQTGELRAEQQKRLEEKLGQKQAELKQISDDVGKLKKLLDETPQSALPQSTLEQLGRAREEAGQLERAMKPLDLEEAQGKAAALRGDLRQTKRELDEPMMQLMRGDPPGARKAAQKIGEAEGLAESIHKRLAELQPKGGEGMSPGERERMQSLDKRQQATRKRLEQLQKKARGEDPGNPQPGEAPVQGLGEQLGQAARHMQGAEGQLRGNKPREALGEESQALEALKEAQKQVQRERRPDPNEGGSKRSNEPVKIPGADEYSAPREFREDILDAMKRASPERYKQQIEKYFQELVR